MTATPPTPAATPAAPTMTATMIKRITIIPIMIYMRILFLVFAESMAALSEKDLDDMINEDHGAEVVCQYCSRKYLYSEDELRAVREIRKRVADRKRAD